MFRQIAICQIIIFTLFLSLPDTLRSAAIQSALSKSFLFVVGQSAKPSGLIVPNPSALQATAPR